MTLDHLGIVHLGMTRVISDLTKGKMPEGTASTATVKPSPQVTADVIPEYEKSCDTLLATVAAAGNLKTELRYAHPWFGPMDAHGWHALAAGHLGFHRVQLDLPPETVSGTLVVCGSKFIVADAFSSP